MKSTSYECLSQCQKLLKKKKSSWFGLAEESAEVEVAAEEEEVAMEVSAEEAEAMQEDGDAEAVWPFSSKTSMCCLCKGGKSISWSASGKCTKGTSKTVKPPSQCIKGKNGKMKSTSYECLSQCQKLLKKKKSSWFGLAEESAE